MADCIEVPLGAVLAWAGASNTVPQNFMICDGLLLQDRAAYEGLFNAIGTAWGGVGPDSFRIPDLRGYFLRGVDGGANRDPDSLTRSAQGSANGNDVGSVQADQFQDHQHATDLNKRNDWPTSGSDEPTKVAGTQPPTDRVTGGAVTGNYGRETRPKNAYVYWIIRVK